MSTTFSRTLSLMACALLLGFTLPAWADDPPEDPPEDQGVYQSQAQIDRAKNVSDAYYNSDQYSADYQSLIDKYDDEMAKEGGPNPEVLAELERQINDWYMNGEGFAPEGVQEMRTLGMGWGEIAHALGLHPSVLGLGHAKKAAATDDVAMATAVDMKSGNGLGHGKSADAAGGKSNDGKGQDKGDHGNKGGNGGNNGNGGGNGGNNGNGGGNGNKNK